MSISKESRPRSILQTAWPIILANSSVPLLGLVDTAIIGHTGDSTNLGAIALGALIFNLVYWSFGFLRMGTTGFVAHADGAANEAEVRAAFARALLFAAVIGLTLIALQWPIATLSLTLLGASEAVERTTESYFFIRIWGALATLALYVVFGVLVGLGKSRELLKVQLLLNGINIILDLWFAGYLQWGVPGIALGTVIAEWLALAYGIYLLLKLLQSRKEKSVAFWSWVNIIDAEKLKNTFQANSDIMIRTLLLLLAFAWFADQSARFGDNILAANYILLQFIAFSAFFLDGFAYATESMVGRAAGAKNLRQFDRVVINATILSGISAALLSLIIFFLGSFFIALLTDISEVREIAQQYLGFVVIYILLSFITFQLDGIFIGASSTKAMRNASIFSSLVFFAISIYCIEAWMNNGLWIAFIIFLVTRALALFWYYPKLREDISSQ